MICLSHPNIISLPDLAREPIKIHLVLATECDMLNCKSFPQMASFSCPRPIKLLLVTEFPGELSFFFFLGGYLRTRPKLALAVIRSQNSLTQFSVLITDQQTYSGSPSQLNHAKLIIGGTSNTELQESKLNKLLFMFQNRGTSRTTCQPN